MQPARKKTARATTRVRAQPAAIERSHSASTTKRTRDIAAQGTSPLARAIGTSSRKHVFTAVAAAACWFTLALQLYASAQVAGVQGGNALDGIWACLAFFTVLTNLLAAILLTAPLVAPRTAAGRFFARPDTLAGVAVNIALVCITYNLLLRDAVDPANLESVSDELLHDFIPPLFVAHAWMKANANPVAMMPRLRWAIWPVLYFCYVLLRGAATGTYPYPFLDVTALGYAGVCASGIGLLAGYAVLATILLHLDRLRWRPFFHGWWPRGDRIDADILPARLRS